MYQTVLVKGWEGIVSIRVNSSNCLSPAQMVTLVKSRGENCKKTPILYFIVNCCQVCMVKVNLETKGFSYCF